MSRAFRILAALLLAVPAFADPAVPISASDAERFGVDIVRAFNARDRGALAKMLDLHALMTRAADYQGLSEPARQNFIHLEESVGIDVVISANFKALDVQKGSAKFMRATRQFPPRSLVRFDLSDLGYSYFEFVLAKDAAGHTRAVDWFQLASGKLTSAQIGEMNLMSSPSNPGLIDRLLGARPDSSTLQTMRRYNDLASAGRYFEAYEQLGKLPEPAASTRTILSLRASMAAMAQRPDDYEKTIEQMARLYADDPAASFMLMDYYFKRQDLPNLLKAIDVMEKRIGIDGVTRQIRGNAYLQSNDLVDALRCMEESIQLEPDRLDARDLRATVLVKLARYADAVDEYRAISRLFNLEFHRETFTREPTFSGFAKSKEFARWLPERPAAN